MRLFFLSLILSLSATCAFAVDTDDDKYKKQTDPSKPPSEHPAEPQEQSADSDDTASSDAEEGEPTQANQQPPTEKTGLRRRHFSPRDQQIEVLQQQVKELTELVREQAQNRTALQSPLPTVSVYMRTPDQQRLDTAQAELAERDLQAKKDRECLMNIIWCACALLCLGAGSAH